MDMNDQTSSIICRTCAKLGSSEMHSIFRMDQSLQFELIPCVKDFFLNTLKINSSDSLPQKMCAACYDLFKSTNAFFEQCENARDSLEKMFKEQLAAPEIELLSVDKVIEYVEPKSEYEEDNSSEDDHFDDEDCDVDHHDSDIELGEYIKPELNEKESDKHKKPAKEKLAAPEIELLSVDKVIEYVEPKSEYEEDNSSKDDHFDDEDCDVDHHDSDIELGEYIKPELNEKESEQIDDTKLDNETEDNTVTVENTTPDSKRLEWEKDLENLKLSTPLLMCPICEKLFKSVGNRNKHIETHNSVNNYKCDSCQKSFKTRVTWGRHIKYSHKIAEYPCEHCNKKYNDEGRFKEHLKIHDDPNATYECKYCGKTCNELQSVLEHEKTHSGPKPYTCRICNVGFGQKGHLNSHVKIHSGEREFKCTICNFGFIRRDQYTNHMWTHENNRPKPNICEHCGKDYASLLSLRYHLRTAHTNKKPYNCEICEKAFALKLHLFNHNAAIHGGPMRVKDINQSVEVVVPPQPVFVEKLHTELPESSNPTAKKLPFVCTICKMAFKLPHGLSKHFQKMHIEVRNFPCDQCGQSFKRKAVLAEHIKTVHLKLRPHKCKICSKGFAQSGTLVSHMRTHTGEKPYPCTICDKSFAIYRVMRHHMRTHTGEKAYKCEICQEDFKHYTTLARHVKLKHKNWTACTVTEVQDN